MIHDKMADCKHSSSFASILVFLAHFIDNEKYIGGIRCMGLIESPPCRPGYCSFVRNVTYTVSDYGVTIYLGQGHFKDTLNSVKGTSRSPRSRTRSTSKPPPPQRMRIKTVMGNWCVTNYGTDVEYCGHGCCGESYNRYCCDLSVAFIIGCVVAGVFVLILLTSLVCCCYHMQKRKVNAGVPVQPVTTVAPSVHVIHQNSPWPNQANNNWQTQSGYFYGPSPPPAYERAPEPAFPPPYCGYSPQNSGLSGNQPTPPSATAGNQSTTGV